MKKIALLSIVIIAISMSLMAEVKIGYVFTDRLLTESNEALEIARLFNLDKQNWKGQIQTADEEVKRMERDFQLTKLTTNAATQKENLQKIEAKKIEVGRMIEEYFGEGGKAEKRYAELLDPLEKKIMEIITKIAEDEKYSMIFDASLRTILYGMASLDITDQVLQELNKGTVPPSDLNQPPVQTDDKKDDNSIKTEIK